MHAYVIASIDKEAVDSEVEKLSRKLKSKVVEFPFSGIKDARDLTSFSALSFSTPTAILVRDIDTSSDETLNAFLKTLEEAKQNLSFILTTSSLHALPPTVLSRCQIVKTSKKEIAGEQFASKAASFLKLSAGEKISASDRFYKRPDAEKFLQELILGCHFLLHKSLEESRDKNPKNIEKLCGYISASNEALKNIRANANIKLQMANLIVGTD